MAAHEYEFTLSWQNGVEIKLTSKYNSGNAITVLEMDENGQISNLTDYIASIMSTFFASKVKEALDDMVS